MFNQTICPKEHLFKLYALKNIFNQTNALKNIFNQTICPKEHL